MEKNGITLARYQWAGYTAVCIAGGASLTQDQVDLCKGHKVIAINDAYKLAPWADILYACDSQWWGWHNGVPTFRGYKLTHQQDAVNLQTYPGIDYIMSDGKSGFSGRQDRIRHGSNGGYQALHIALSMGASRIILLGYDMHANTGKSHWFGEHPTGKQRDSRYAEWIKEFSALEIVGRQRGQEIINCTPNSALDCFIKRKLGEVL